MLSRLQAFAFLLPNVVTSDWVATHGRLFLGEEPTSIQALQDLRQQAPRGVRVALHILCHPPPSSEALQEPQIAEQDLLYLRHQGLVSVRVVGALNNLQPGFRWTVERLHLAEDTPIPFFDRSLQNSSLMAQIVGTLLGGSSRCLGLRLNQPPPPNCVLSLGVYADGYRPRGRGNVNIKVCLIDEGGSLFPIRAHIPQCTLQLLLTWREMLKNDYDLWVRQVRAEELNKLQKTPFCLPVRRGGCTHNVGVRVQFRFFTTDHHHLWWERGGRCCVVCPWQRHQGVRELFQSDPHPLQVVGRMFSGVEGLAQAFVSRPVLHNLKGGISRGCGVVGRILPADDECAMHRYICAVAPRYKLGDVPQDSTQYCSLVRRRFRTGVSFTGREAREFAALIA